MDEVEVYAPFTRGLFPAGVLTIVARDERRGRTFPCEIWYPAADRHRGQDLRVDTQDTFTNPRGGARRSQAAVRHAEARPGAHPLVLFSHPSGSDRRSATFLCTHLASHGYLVAALDHSESVAPELSRRDGESDAQRTARWDAVIASRVPDVQLLLERLLAGAAPVPGATLDAGRLGLVGHSLGGWTALAVPDVEPRVRAVVALAPGGSSNPRPGILPVRLDFAWGRDVPTLIVAAEDDSSLPLAGMHEIYARTPAARRLVILRRADHMHFMDEVAELHEAFRTMPLSGALAAIQRDMQPMAQLCPGSLAHLALRGLVLAHLDATLRGHAPARRLLAGDVQAALAERGVEVLARGD